jgi:hypothetical protein
MDKALLWRIDPEKQEYSEMPLPAPGTAAKGSAKVTVDVKPTGEKQTIDGFHCERVILTATRARERVTVDRWLVSEDGPGLSEIAGFYRSYGELAIRRALRDVPPEVWTGYGAALEALGQKLAGLSGVAMRSTLTIEDPQRRDSKAKPDSTKAGGALFTMTTDVLSINNDTPPPGSFDLPPGFKLTPADAARP